MSTTFQEYWDYSQRHIPAMIRILRANAMHLISVEIADEHQDTKESTDLVVRVTGGEVAVRTRRKQYGKQYRDFTIRSKSRYGQKTELDKLREGFARWYLYAWEADYGYDYILVDMDAVRSAGLLDVNRPERCNRDGTRFIAIDLAELRQHGCIVQEGKS